MISLEISAVQEADLHGYRGAFPKPRRRQREGLLSSTKRDSQRLQEKLEVTPDLFVLTQI